MSQYEAYDQTAGHYDSTRSAIGIEIWLGNLASNFVDISKIHILDAGCGTGNYTLALAPRVSCVTGMDLNEQMLTEARRKAVASALTDKVLFQLGELPNSQYRTSRVEQLYGGNTVAAAAHSSTEHSGSGDHQQLAKAT